MNLKAFISLSAAIFVAMLGMGIISPLMALYAQSMGASGFWLGVMYSGFALSRTILMPLTGWLSDQRGKKNIILIGLSGYAIMSFLYAAASNIYQLSLVRLLHGAASAMVVPVAMAYIGDLIPQGKEGTYMNLFYAVMFLGMGFGPLLGGTLSDAFNVSTVFYTMGGFSATALLLLFLLVPQMEPQSKRHRGKAAPFTTMLKDNKIKAVSLFMASRGLTRQSVVAFLPLFAVNSLNMSRTTVGLIISCFMLAEGVTGSLFGPLADRYNKNALMIAGSLVSPLLVFLLPGMDNALSILAILVPVALFNSLGRAPAMVYNVQAGVRYQRMGSAMGVVHTAMALGHLIGPMVSGYIMDYFDIGAVFYFGAVVGVISTFLMTYWLFRKEPKLIESVIPEATAAELRK